MVQERSKNSLSVTAEDNAELIEHQLTKILTSPYFKSAKKMRNFLQYIVRKTLSGKTNYLKQYTIAVEALGFPVDFDSDSNPVVRIIAGRVRERLTKYYEMEGSNDDLLITMPKGSYVPVFEKNKNVKKPPKKERSGYSVPPKLAVLCYSDETQDLESNRLLFQVTDTMAMELSNFLFVNLVVSIPHADKKFSRDASIDMKNRYQADYMLVFYIQQLPKKRHKILIRLMDVSDESVIWSDSYELNPDEAFDEQYEIIAKVTAIVADIQQGLLYHHWARKLLLDEENIPESSKVIAYYRYYNDDLGLEAFTKAVRVCEKKLLEYPSDVINNVIYSDYCRRDYVYGFNVIDNALETGKRCASEAVRRNPNSSEAHYGLAQILFCQHEWSNCVSELNLAQDIGRYHASIEYGVGFHFCLMGFWEDGLEIVNRIRSLSAAYPSWYNLPPFLNAYRLGRYDEALDIANKIDTPTTFHGYLARTVAYAQLGEKERAKKELKNLLDIYPAFMEQGKELLIRFLGSDELANQVWEGVKKAAT